MTVLDVQINNGADDVYWNEGTTWSTTAFFVIAGNTSGNLYSSAMRFTSVSIPQGATIDVSYVSREAYSTRSNTIVNTIWSANDVDNAVSPTSNTEAKNLVQTTAKVEENNIPTWTSGVWYDSPSLNPVLKEVVDRPGWASGNAMLLRWGDNVSTNASGIYRQANSYDKGLANAPKLHIEYTASTITNTAPTFSVGIGMNYNSFTRLGPNNTPVTLTFTPSDAEQTGANALSYTIRTAASGGGTLVGSGTCTSGVSKSHSISNAASGLVDGEQTLYLRLYDGALYSADNGFSLRRDIGTPTVGTITHSPNPVTG